VAAVLAALGLAHAQADDILASKGARIYDKNCSQCHGDDLQNNAGVAFDLRRLKASEHSRFIDSVLHGKRAMPSWEGALSMDEIENLWAYVRAHGYQ
jgi:mono/diheme cytochrome c family protein